MNAHASATDRHVVVVGAGGNIGSHLVPHLARMPEIGTITLIDPDRYEEHNVRNQAIGAASVGALKVRVQANVVRRIAPRLEIRALAAPVEAVPLGSLRADVILACLDTRRARQHVNQTAARLGVPWIDAGVLADGLLARIDNYVPGPEAACLECGWDDHDYAAIEQAYPCADMERPSMPSDVPSSLGALAAALQALECRKLLVAGARAAAGAHDGTVARGEQIVIGAAHGCHYRTARRYNPDCRLGSHAAWTIGELPIDVDTTSLHDLFAALAERTGASDGIRLRVAGKHFVTAASCAACGATRRTLRLAPAAGVELPQCSRCRRRKTAAGAGMSEFLEAKALSTAELRRSLRAVGFRPHEVITACSSAGELHVELSQHRASAHRAHVEQAAAGAGS